MGNRTTSILLVDDNSTFLGIVTRFLEGHPDIQVIGAVQGGNSVLTKAQELRPDIVLIDITLPSLPGGLKFIPSLRAALPQTGIIALTLLGTDGYRRAALEAGVDEFIPKANMGAELLSAIRRVEQTYRDRGSAVDT